MYTSRVRTRVRGRQNIIINHLVLYKTPTSELRITAAVPEKIICTPRCASFEIRTPHPQQPPPLAESTWKLHKPQHSNTGHPIAFGLGWRFGSDGRRQAPRPNPPEHCPRTNINNRDTVPDSHDFNTGFCRLIRSGHVSRSYVYVYTYIS